MSTIVEMKMKKIFENNCSINVEHIDEKSFSLFFGFR